MVEPLRYYDENGVLLLEREGWHGGSIDYPQKVFNCSKCYKKYFSPSACKRHSTKCFVPISNIIYKNGDISIVKIIDNTNKHMINAVFNLAYFSKREQGVDIVLINPSEGFNLIQPVYAIFKDGRLIGYIAYWKQRLIRTIDDKDEPFYPWIMWDIYVIKSERKKGYASLLCNRSLEDLKESYGSIFYSYPLSKDAINLIKSKGLMKINLKHPAGWTPNVPLN